MAALLCRVSFMLGVTYTLIMLSVVKLIIVAPQPLPLEPGERKYLKKLNLLWMYDVASMLDTFLRHVSFCFDSIMAHMCIFRYPRVKNDIASRSNFRVYLHVVFQSAFLQFVFNNARVMQFWIWCIFKAKKLEKRKVKCTAKSDV